MAADAFEREFARIYNKALRDSRTSFKAKGILGMLSTHQDGFGLTLESIDSFATDGIASVRAGLDELKEFGYVHRKPRRSDGTDGKRKGTIVASDYRITDMPDGLTITIPAPERADDEDPRSAPSCENRTLDEGEQTRRSEPTCDFPPEENPPEENRPLKKTNNQKTSTSE